MRFSTKTSCICFLVVVIIGLNWRGEGPRGRTVARRLRGRSHDLKSVTGRNTPGDESGAQGGVLDAISPKEGALHLPRS